MIITMHNEKIDDICNKIKNLQQVLKYEKKNIFNNMENIKNNKKKKKIINSYDNNKQIKILKEIKNTQKIINDVREMIKLSLELNDNSIFIDLKKEINNIENKINNIKIQNIFKKKNDICNCYLDIQSGSGGIDAQDWSQMLLKMYLKWLCKKGFKTKIIHELYGDIAGIKSATIHVIGKYAFGWLRTETGIHRLIRKSPFDSGSRRHTSFSSAFVYPEINNDINIKIKTSDLRIDVYRSSGAGGQHVNRTESAVRITHLPTSIVTQCQNERSQHKNKEQALKQMKLKLYNLEIKKKQNEKKMIENTKSSIGWGHHIRSYILDNSRIKDNRTGIEVRNIDSVLNGNLDIFIETSLKQGL
ncbi:peptide chain release factor 2 [Buchnera aphidicola]|uniref:peptide chain release factor 2 n=1 Tax=Buchnera aphidicola TaxID=9 RepID=UPI003463BF08